MQKTQNSFWRFFSIVVVISICEKFIHLLLGGKVLSLCMYFRVNGLGVNRLAGRELSSAFL